MWWAAASTTQGFLEMSGQRSGMPVQGQRWWWAVVVVMAVSALVGAFAERSWLPGLLVTESVAAVVFCWFWRYRYGIDSPEIAWDYVVDIVSASVFLMLPASFALYVGVLARRLGRWLQPRRPEPTVGAPPLRS
jgi:hypothetical protein